MGTLLKDIPGLAEKLADARRREAELRDLPFLGVDLDIGGVAVKQITPRHWLYLDAAGVPFFCAEAMNPVHVALFLWILSPKFRPGDIAARDAFLLEIVNVDYAAAVKAIGEFVDDAFLDRPEGGGSSSAPTTSYVAAIIDMIATGGYTWTKDVILDTPFAELFQYIRRIEQRLYGVPLINRFTDRARREAVLAHREAQKGVAA